MKRPARFILNLDIEVATTGPYGTSRIKRVEQGLTGKISTRGGESRFSWVPPATPIRLSWHLDASSRDVMVREISCGGEALLLEKSTVKFKEGPGNRDNYVTPGRRKGGPFTIHGRQEVDFRVIWLP